VVGKKEVRADLLKPREIVEIFPPALIRYMIKGIQSSHGLFLSIILNEGESDPAASHGTGKVFITDDTARKPYCLLLRERSTCSKDDRNAFETAKRNVSMNPSSKGAFYTCCGGLKTISVPIVEKESKTFIGAILAGQKRPAESFFAAKRRLRELVARKGKESLRGIPFWKLLRLFLQLEKISEKELAQQKKICENLANEIGERFTYFVRERIADSEYASEQQHALAIITTLIEVASLNQFWDSMLSILTEMHSWLRFDWGAAFKSKNESEVSEMVAYFGEETWKPALSNGGLVLGKLDLDPRLSHNPRALRSYIHKAVPSGKDFWLLPLVADSSCIGGLIFGFAETSSTSSQYLLRVEKAASRLEEIQELVQIEYRELRAIDRERQKREALEKQETMNKTVVQKLHETLIISSHQMHRPLIGVQSLLSLIRDKLDDVSKTRLDQILELAIIGTSHASLLASGVSKILKFETGSGFEVNPIDIDTYEEGHAVEILHQSRS